MSAAGQLAHLSHIAEILAWAAVSVYLALTGAVILRATRVTRRRDARIAARAANAEHWQGVRRMLDSDPPPSCDPLVTKNPRTPQRGEDHA